MIDSVTDINNLTNECTGTGHLKFRLGDGETREQIVQRLEKVGVKADNPTRPGGLNNNYTEISYVNWNDHHVQVQEGKHISTDFVDPKTQKVKHLSSNIVMGENDSLVNHAKNF